MSVAIPLGYTIEGKAVKKIVSFPGDILRIALLAAPLPSPALGPIGTAL